MCEVIYEARNEQRNSPGLEILESPSSSDHRGSSNNRNLRTSSSGRDNSLELECRKLRAEVATLTAELEKARAAAIQSDKMHDEIREFHEKGRELHEKERKFSNAKISELEKELRISKRQSQEAREAQRVAEIDLERIKLNIKLETLTSSRCQSNTDSQSDMKSEFGDRSDETAKLEDDSTPLSGFNLQQLEIEGDGSSFQGGTELLGLEAPGADQSIDTAQGEIEGELTGECQEGMEQELTGECQEVMEQEETEESSLQVQIHQLENPGRRQLPLQLKVCLPRQTTLVSRQGKEDLRENSMDEASSSLSKGSKGWNEGSSVVDPKWSSFFSKIDSSGKQIPDPSDDVLCPGHPRAAAADDNDDGDDGDPARTARVGYTRLNVGKHHSILVARTFLRINWEEYYRKLENGDWECIRCDRTFSRRSRAVDHVWSAHHGGKFECPHCHESFTIRGKIKNHAC